MSAKADLIVGLQWGDEGKGKIVESLDTAIKNNNPLLNW